jgi:hypothetical protein
MQVWIFQIKHLYVWYIFIFSAFIGKYFVHKWIFYIKSWFFYMIVGSSEKKENGYTFVWEANEIITTKCLGCGVCRQRHFCFSMFQIVSIMDKIDMAKLISWIRVAKNSTT